MCDVCVCVCVCVSARVRVCTESVLLRGVLCYTTLYYVPLCYFISVQSRYVT